MTKKDWEIPLEERPDWYQTDEGHWRHKSYGKKKKQKQTFNKLNIRRNEPCPCGSGKKYKKCCKN